MCAVAGDYLAFVNHLAIGRVILTVAGQAMAIIRLAPPGLRRDE
jgi:hypothetical protein